MTLTSQYEKLDALFAHVANAEGLPAVVFPNTSQLDKIRETGEPYLLAFDMPRRTDSRGLNGVNDKGGILQFNVCIRLGIGDFPAYAIADTLLNIFPRNTRMGNIRIDLSCSLGVPMSDETRRFLPVMVPYRYID